MRRLIAAAGVAALGLGLITAAAAPAHAAASAGTKYQQTCDPWTDYSPQQVPVGDYECYVNAIADGPVYIHAWSSVLKHYTLVWQYCINWAPKAPGAETARENLPAQIEIKNPYCKSDYGLPRGLVSVHAVLPAADVPHTLLWITTPTPTVTVTVCQWFGLYPGHDANDPIGNGGWAIEERTSGDFSDAEDNTAPWSLLTTDAENGLLYPPPVDAAQWDALMNANVQVGETSGSTAALNALNAATPAFYATTAGHAGATCPVPS